MTHAAVTQSSQSWPASPRWILLSNYYHLTADQTAWAKSPETLGTALAAPVELVVHFQVHVEHVELVVPPQVDLKQWLVAELAELVVELVVHHHEQVELRQTLRNLDKAAGWNGGMGGLVAAVGEVTADGHVEAATATIGLWC
eukprot:5491171-Amphidinium_carterae.1